MQRTIQVRFAFPKYRNANASSFFIPIPGFLDIPFQIQALRQNRCEEKGKGLQVECTCGHVLSLLDNNACVRVYCNRRQLGGFESRVLEHGLPGISERIYMQVPTLRHWRLAVLRSIQQYG